MSLDTEMIFKHASEEKDIVYIKYGILNNFLNKNF